MIRCRKCSKMPGREVRAGGGFIVVCECGRKTKMHPTIRAAEGEWSTMNFEVFGLPDVTRAPTRKGDGDAGLFG